MTLPDLKPLHSDATLSRTKLLFFERWSTEKIIASLATAQEHSLKVKADGTVMDGHHRLHVLRARGENIHLLPRDPVKSAQV